MVQELMMQLSPADLKLFLDRIDVSETNLLLGRP